jgi:hypothetical protein
MRKWLWCAAAAAIVGVGGVGYYAYQKPQSLVGQVVTQVGQISIQANPVAQLTRQALATAGHKEVVCCQVPEEPTPETPPEDPTPVTDAGPVSALLGLNLLQDMRGPDPIVIHDEEPVVVPEAGPEVGAIPSAPLPTGEPPIAEPGTSPRVMPYSQEEGIVQVMPHAGEGSADPYDPANFPGPGSESSVPGATEEAEPKNEDPQADTGSMSGSSHCTSSCHSRYIVCPYSGKCVEVEPTGDSQKDCSATKDECKTAEEEYEKIPAPREAVSADQEPGPTKPAVKTKKTRKKVIKTQSNYTPGSVLAPYIDTMEYRASDRSLNETGPGPY